MTSANKLRMNLKAGHLSFSAHHPEPISVENRIIDMKLYSYYIYRVIVVRYMSFYLLLLLCNQI